MKERDMGQAVVHFEVVGKDGAKLQGYYTEMFGWKMNADNPMNYALVEPAGSAKAPMATRDTSPSTSRCLTSRRPWPRPKASAGPG
jgi:predicted enzyme related to lactoylglutathione lyase